ncbi:MAG TPA: hypothetical protein PK544_16990, partial [Spirochaetota bacterium]|nr:hypothetical protein [Spirochaetota bacterium]
TKEIIGVSGNVVPNVFQKDYNNLVMNNDYVLTGVLVVDGDKRYVDLSRSYIPSENYWSNSGCVGSVYSMADLHYNKDGSGPYGVDAKFDLAGAYANASPDIVWGTAARALGFYYKAEDITSENFDSRMNEINNALDNNDIVPIRYTGHSAAIVGAKYDANGKVMEYIVRDPINRPGRTRLEIQNINGNRCLYNSDRGRTHGKSKGIVNRIDWLLPR